MSNKIKAEATVKTKKINTTMYVSEDVRDIIKRKAKDNNLSMSDFINIVSLTALRKGIDKEVLKNFKPEEVKGKSTMVFRAKEEVMAKLIDGAKSLNITLKDFLIALALEYNLKIEITKISSKA